MWVQKIGGGGVSGLAYSPDGATLYTRDHGGWVTAWDVVARRGKRLFQLSVMERYAQHGLALADGGRLLVADGRDGARVWDVAAGAEGKDMPAGLRSGPLLVAPDAPAVRYIGQDCRGIDAYDLNTGGVTRLFESPPELPDLLSADVAPDGRSAVLLALASQAGRIDANGLWHDLECPFSGRVWFSPGGDRLLWTMYYRIQVWDVATWTKRAETACFMPDWVFAVSPTAPVFVACNPERQLTLFSLETGHPLRSLDFALGKYVMCAAFSPDGLTCAVGGTNKQFAVFDVDV